MLYVKKRGTLNAGLRLEWLFARQAYQFALSNVSERDRNKVHMRDYLRYHDQPKEADAPAEMTAAQMAERFAMSIGRPIERKVNNG